jgi:hypothetical protein
MRSDARDDNPAAVSPGFGPLPPVYLPPPGQPDPAGLLWRAMVRAARRAARRRTAAAQVREPRTTP